jgi:RNA polymerase sigma-70 factor, ECF subfamily
VANRRFSIVADNEKPSQPDPQAFRRLVMDHQAYAYRLAYRLLLDEDDARDVAQESFIRIWRHWSCFRPEARFTTWLYKIVVNLCYDQLRIRARRKTVLEKTEDIDSVADPADLGRRLEQQDLLSRLQGSIDRLPLKQRTVFILRDLEGLSIDEVRRITGLSAATIKTNLYHARHALRRGLVNDFNQESS